MNLSRKEKTVWQLFAVANQARHHLNQVLGRYQMTTTSFHILRVAMAAGVPVSVTELAKAASVPRPDMTRILDRMERMGWVYRTRNPEDRRIVSVRVTDEGRAALSEVEELAAQACEEITKYFDDADMIGLSEHFKNIVDAVEEHYA
jgi:DNA-binding MarR family transcriptional regulator